MMPIRNWLRLYLQTLILVLHLRFLNANQHPNNDKVVIYSGSSEGHRAALLYCATTIQTTISIILIQSHSTNFPTEHMSLQLATILAPLDCADVIFGLITRAKDSCSTILILLILVTGHQSAGMWDGRSLCYPQANSTNWRRAERPILSYIWVFFGRTTMIR